MPESLREQRGRRVREVWVRWAAEQPDPKDSWLTPWEDLDEGQREVDMRIGEAQATDERERIRQQLDDIATGFERSHKPGDEKCRHAEGIRYAINCLDLAGLTEAILDGEPS